MNGDWYRGLLVAGVAVSAMGAGACLAAGPRDEAMRAKAAEAHELMWREFICPKTLQVYTCLDAKTRRPDLPSHADVKAGKPNACGWGTGIENCALDGGAYLGAMIDRYAVTGKPEHADEARKIFRGLMLIARSAARPGFIPRGVMLDGKAHYPESSVDQYTMYVYGLWRYFRGPIATSAEKDEISRLLAAVLKRLEIDRFVILTDTGGRTTFGALDRLAPSRAERLLGIVLAGADVTGDEHWREVYRRLRGPRLMHCRGKGGDPWVLVQNQLALFLLANIEKDPAALKVYEAARREVALECLPHLRPPDKFKGLAVANSLEGSLAVVLSEDKDLIAKHLKAIEQAVTAHDYRTIGRSVAFVRPVECIYWSLARQGLLTAP